MDFIREVYRTSNARVVTVDTALLNRGVAVYDARGDKEWGMTDCGSVVAMREAGLSEALTADHHFEQAGFVALMRRDPP